MSIAAGESELADLRAGFDRRVKLEFHGSRVTSDAGLLAFRELDDALGLTEMAGQVFADTRTGKNGRHTLMAQFRQSVFGRLAGYEDVNDADRLGHDPAMRWIVGGRAVMNQAASTNQMGRFETEVLTQKANLAALADLSGQWIDAVHPRRFATKVVLDMDSSVSPTHGEQEGAAYNGHFGCTCYHPLFVFNQFGDLERCALRSGNVHSADNWRVVLGPVVERYRGTVKRRFFRGDAAFALPDLYEFLEAEGYRSFGRENVWEHDYHLPYERCQQWLWRDRQPAHHREWGWYPNRGRRGRFEGFQFFQPDADGKQRGHHEFPAAIGRHRGAGHGGFARHDLAPRSRRPAEGLDRLGRAGAWGGVRDAADAAWRHTDDADAKSGLNELPWILKDGGRRCAFPRILPGVAGGMIDG